MSEYIKKEDVLFKKWQFKFKDVDGEHWFVNVKDIESLPTYSFPEREKGTDLITLNAQGLDEGIRCAMCTNSMANDRGCDGGCVVDTAMYERVLKVIEENTVPEREKETDEEKDPWEYMDDIERSEATEYLESLEGFAEWPEEEGEK